MGRSKMPRVPNTSQDLSEEARRVLEHAASILNLPVANLLTCSGSSLSPGLNRSMVGSLPMLEDIGKAADSDDTVEWHSSAAEFDGIDPDLAGVYFDLDYWVDGHSHVGAAPTATAESANGSGDQRQVPSGPWQPAQPRPMPPPRPPSLSWELVETAVDPTALQTARNPSEWTMIQARPSHPQLPKSADTPAVEELRIISVNPNQSQPRPQRRKAFGDRERQEETGQTRGLKACVRCRMQKIRVHHLPCLRHRLTECTLYRTGKAPGLEFTFRWPVMKLKDIDNWAAPEVRTILVQSDVCPVPLQLAVRKFVPIPGKDSLTRSWMDHKKQTKKYLETTPYAIYDMQKAVQDMRDHISEENYNNARKHGLLRRYAIPNFIQERHHSANVFLSHYHYRTESANPFIQDWKRRHATPFSHMSVDEIHFLERTKAMVRDRAVIKINRQTDLYEHELYFIAQMFEENWQPRDTIIDRTEGTVNNVGLKRYAGK
ncbi:hypothetical protein B0T24DRAFT_710668 [Lasiosphaeria ovina]|uniref:Uncharacterized protein n=1 Tax=Lasiosphaeria ovina TaxID=92902 RepID=A0AAE0JW77_9PEZI|nr:hypothetical protein B0T24DRAFT_710668 [Lasiosphaeria ovina]